MKKLVIIAAVAVAAAFLVLMLPAGKSEAKLAKIETPEIGVWLPIDYIATDEKVAAKIGASASKVGSITKSAAGSTVEQPHDLIYLAFDVPAGSDSYYLEGVNPEDMYEVDANFNAHWYKMFCVNNQWYCVGYVGEFTDEPPAKKMIVDHTTGRVDKNFNYQKKQATVAETAVETIEYDDSYLEGEDLFYNDTYDHSNVDLVYDKAYVENYKANNPEYKSPYHGQVEEISDDEVQN